MNDQPTHPRVSDGNKEVGSLGGPQGSVWDGGSSAARELSLSWVMGTLLAFVFLNRFQ